MIDLHSHVLPNMDDGSKSVQETMQMLRTSAQQSVTTMVATPHFYANREDPARFLRRRSQSFAQLEQEQLPVELFLGAEVTYFPGMGRCEDLKQLCIGDTKLILVEMPFSAWNDRMIDEVFSLQASFGLIPVLAHVERYYDNASLLKYKDLLLREDVLFQANAEGFLPFFGGKRMLTMLKKQQIHFLGTDCHGMNRRVPNMGEAVKKIQKSLGTQALQALDEFAAMILK